MLGQSGSGKTFLSLDLIATLDSSSDFDGYVPVVFRLSPGPGSQLLGQVIRTCSAWAEDLEIRSKQLLLILDNYGLGAHDHAEIQNRIVNVPTLLSMDRLPLSKLLVTIVF